MAPIFLFLILYSIQNVDRVFIMLIPISHSQEICMKQHDHVLNNIGINDFHNFTPLVVVVDGLPF